MCNLDPNRVERDVVRGPQLVRILFLSFYYPPDLSAGSFRSSALIQALLRQLPPSSHIDVVTTMPNRYSSFNAGATEVEETGNLSIQRVSLPHHKSGMLDQSKAFIAYAREVSAHVLRQKYDLVYATSSRLMTGVLGAYIARSHKVPLYLDIRDIFVDTIQDILPRWLAWPMGGVFSQLERYAIGYASKVNLVSRGFEHYFLRRYPEQCFAFFPNGIDEEFKVSAPASNSCSLSAPPYSVVYAGNLGEGQGLHTILPDLAKAMHGRVEFTVIGDGGRKVQLQKALDEAGVDNVTLQDPVNRNALVQAYLGADALFLHLNDHAAFRKVLPSKLFEYAAIGKPIWAGVAGYAAEFIEHEIENAAVFPPCDIDAAIRAFSMLQMRPISRTQFVRKYERHSIMQSLAKDIISLGRGGRE